MKTRQRLLKPSIYPASWLKVLMNWWGPFWGTGIRVETISDDFRFVRVIIKRRWYNGNYVGVHFGGSLFAMTDPFYMLMLIRNLGKNFIVWDKAATIHFKKPGKGTLYAEFELNIERLEEIRQTAYSAGKLDAQFEINIYNSSQEIIAQIQKTVFIKYKQPVL